MTRSVSIRVLQRFFGLDLLFGSLVPLAQILLLGLPLDSKTLAIEGAVVATRLALSVYFLFAILAPADEWESTGSAARSDAMVLRAVSTLQSAPWRFSIYWVGTWVLHFALQTALLYWLAPERVDATLLPTTAITLAAVVPGAFTFSFPILFVFLSSPQVEAVKDAQQRRLELPSNRIGLGFRVGLLILGIGIAPTLWVVGVGYQTEVDGTDALAFAGAAREAARLAQAEGPREGLSEVARTVGSRRYERGFADVRGTLLAGGGTLETVDGLDGALRRAIAEAPREGAFLYGGRAIAYERTDRGVYAIAAVRHEQGASTGFIATIAIFLLVVMLWAPMVAAALSWSISKPIERMSEASQHLVEEGALDKLEPLPIVGGDEIGVLTERFNAIVEMLRHLSGAAHDVALGDLRVSVEGKGDLPDAFRGMLENLRTIVLGIRENAATVSAAAAQIYAASQEQEAASSAQSGAVHEIGSTMESLADSAAHVAESVQGVRDNAERTLETADQMVKRIAELTARAGRVSEILQVIREIADRTDLLALNGSLEATRAGESGRGFALLASEMRRLAERVGTAVADVRTLMDDIRDSGASTAMATEEGRKLADDTAEAARSIALVTQQQRTGTEQVSQSVRDIIDVVGQAATATTHSRTAAQDLKTQADRLLALVERFRVTEGG